MFYRWRVHHAPETRCYIIAMVPEPTPLAASTKPYVAEGNVSAIEIWNVTHPGPLHSLSWNTRPQRVSLLGTVEFAPPPVYDGHTQDAKELWTPTPMFDCSDDLVLTIEIACQDCRIEFEQTFDPPALGEKLHLTPHRYSTDFKPKHSICNNSNDSQLHRCTTATIPGFAFVVLMHKFVHFFPIPAHVHCSNPIRSHHSILASPI